MFSFGNLILLGFLAGIVLFFWAGLAVINGWRDKQFHEREVLRSREKLMAAASSRFVGNYGPEELREHIGAVTGLVTELAALDLQANALLPDLREAITRGEALVPQLRRVDQREVAFPARDFTDDSNLVTARNECP